MQKILVIAQSLPAADRQGGMLRFFHLLEALTAATSFPSSLAGSCNRSPNTEQSAQWQRHDAALRDLGISVQYGEWHVLNKLLHSNQLIWCCSSTIKSRSRT